MLAATAMGILDAPRGGAASIRYVYDGLGRLVGVVDAAGDAAVYGYDAVGNLLTISRHAAGAVSIIEFTPHSGPVGSSVTIAGIGFSSVPGQNAVRFNGTLASVMSATATEIVTSVPAGATTGLISVTTPQGTAVSADLYMVTASGGVPTITGFDPAIGVAGTAVTVSGANFESIPGNNHIAFNERQPAPVDVATPATLRTAVPPGTGSGRIAVATPAGRAVSAADFFVPPAPYAAADVAATGRLVGAGALTVALTTPAKIALIVFDGAAGERLVLGFASVTIPNAIATLYTPDATVLNTVVVGPPGASANLILPMAGTYTILLAPDAASTGAATLSLATPDLVPTALTVPASVNAQQSLAATWTVQNRGTGSVGGLWADQLLISPSPVCCAGAQSLGVWNWTMTVAAGESYTATRSVTIPALAAGSYYMLLATDATGLLHEGSEANNVLAHPVTVTAPDLVVETLTAPASVSTQQSVDVSWTLRNQGSGPASGLWSDVLYLSPSSVCCAGATALGAWNIAAGIAAGGTHTQTRTVTVPKMTAGQYYLIASTDSTNLIREANEANNALSRPIAVTTPDLVPTALTAPYFSSPGQSVALSWSVQNQGTGPGLGLWADSVYISSSPTCCAGATHLLTVNLAPGVAAKKSYGVNQTARIPSLAPGVYYVIVKADSTNLLHEASEANNERSKIIFILRP